MKQILEDLLGDPELNMAVRHAIKKYIASNRGKRHVGLLLLLEKYT